MTKAKAEKIIELRKSGLGYQAIAKEIGVSRDSVRSFCKNHNIEPETIARDDKRYQGCCPNCHKRLQKQKSGRPRKFCSKECQVAYWNTYGKGAERATEFTAKCKYCGREFSTYVNQNKKYCCHEHFVIDRYWNFNHDENYQVPEEVLELWKERTI